MEGKKLRIAGVTLAATLMSGTAYANNGADLLGQQVVDFGGSTESIRDLFQKRGGGKILAAGANRRERSDRWHEGHARRANPAE